MYPLHLTLSFTLPGARAFRYERYHCYVLCRFVTLKLLCATFYLWKVVLLVFGELVLDVLWTWLVCLFDKDSLLRRCMLFLGD